MKTLRKNVVPLAVLVGAVVIVAAVAAVGATHSPAPSAGKLWLAQFVGDEVVVTFITTPPDMGKAARANLIAAESAGIVLKFGKEEIFFTFANIIAVEPAR